MLRDAPLKFTRELPDTLTVQSVEDAGVRIDGRIWSGTIALTTESILDDWQHKPFGDLVADDFAALLEHSPELVILGTGQSSQFAPRELMFAFARKGIGLEVMDTAAAARTFNVLVSEGRRVAAVLYRNSTSAG